MWAYYLMIIRAHLFPWAEFRVRAAAGPASSRIHRGERDEPEDPRGLWPLAVLCDIQSDTDDLHRVHLCKNAQAANTEDHRRLVTYITWGTYRKVKILRRGRHALDFLKKNFKKLGAGTCSPVLYGPAAHAENTRTYYLSTRIQYNHYRVEYSRSSNRGTSQNYLFICVRNEFKSSK